MPFEEHEMGRYGLRAGDLLVCEGGEPGRCAIWTGTVEPMMFQKALHRVRPHRALDASYLRHHLEHDARNQTLDDLFTGTTIKHLTGASLAKYEVRVPPLNEQRRIVAKLEALMARSRRAKEALQAIPPLLDQLRQSILAAAFRGDLTADWREQHPDVEPASELLKRIRAERRRRWEEAELGKMKAKGKVPGDDRWKERYEEPEGVDESELPELPEGWCWASLRELGADPFSPVQTGPFGAQLHNTDFVEDGVPVIAVGNLTGLGFTKEGLYFVTLEKARQLERYDVQSGDLLFARSGATLGKVCVAPEYVKDWRMTGHILRARLNRHVVVPALVAYALRGDPAVTRQVFGGVRGMTRPGYNTELLERIGVALPPLQEQYALVSLVGDALLKVDALADLKAETLDSVAELDSAILARAFRGELVPQEPNDEPASALIERIRAGNESQPSARRARGRKAPCR